MTRVAVIFIAPSSGALGEPPSSDEWIEEKVEEVLDNLNELFPEIEFVPYRVEEPADVSEFTKKEERATGYLVFVLNSVRGLIRPILQSGKPTILVGETYGGAGEYLPEHSRAQSLDMPVVGISTRDITNKKVLKNVKFLDVIGNLRNSKVMFIVSPAEKQLMDYEYPLSVDLWSSLRSVQTITGITPVTLDTEKFVEKYYDRVDENEAEDVADRWIEESVENEEEKIDEIKKSAKLYLAIKKSADDYDVDAVAIDCIVLYRNDLLPAWPCLAFMEMYKEGETVPVCEADPYAATALLVMKYLADLPGFINDPSPDDLTQEVVYYHCYAPVNPHGSSEKSVPFRITPAHLGGKHASVCTELPTNETITVIGLDPENGNLPFHTAEAVRNERSDHSCSTKLVGKTNTEALAKNWKWRSGWHRVAFYGDWREEIKKLARLLSLNVIEEDK
ncbi:hypothetical protein AKJ57_01985 [candidate division MSBL1 archaeon SCGC-AAA259A05]|uniref:Fucose isomerase n=1 Tax=candidate division MSBL1 archaeon SCGC-AAA259A05 TaxID=1698259 RepID=A0A133UAL8_9EURY|nr:hypothetical protein AKJ57_01985 [candidate division MSBL1 archaeon SCGC-AAA259A05]